MAQNISGKRFNLAFETVEAVERLVDALLALEALGEERLKLEAPFVQADFDDTPLQHLTPAMIGTLFDFVVPSLSANYADAPNGGRNQQILLQMRR